MFLFHQKRLTASIQFIPFENRECVQLSTFHVSLGGMNASRLMEFAHSTASGRLKAPATSRVLLSKV